jgi:hypothetical protein
MTIAFLMVAVVAIGCQAQPVDAPKDNIVKVSQNLSTVVSTESDVPQEAVNAANEGLNKWPKVMGIDPGIKEVRLGEPYSLFEVSMETVINKTSISEDDLIRRDVWYFPIIGDGKYVLWMKVQNTSEGWKTVGAGGSAANLQNLETDLKEQGVSARRSLIRVTALGLDFVAIEKGSARDSQGVLSGDLYPYGLQKKASGVERPSLQARKSIDKAGMLGYLKESADEFGYEGIKR